MRSLLLLLVAVTWLAAPGFADPPRVLPAGKLPNDQRLEPLKTLDGYFPFAVPQTKEQWEARAAELRRQTRLALGLWPWPTRTPSEPVVHGKVQRDGYTVEKVYLQSYPGHYVTGNLYRPTNSSAKKHPAVLCPHGHWANGRFYDAGQQRVRQQIVQGAERFEVGGRYPIQARCAQLARMGCVVFNYDMIGYADSQQMDHRPGYRKELDTKTDWGYFSTQAELRLQNMMGLQAWNSVRALDWVSRLPEVDPERIAVTGASGGGTQTFILCAIDPRPAVSFPAVMVSTAMQGGCTCENAPYLRVETGNIELAALFAPKPLGMTAADDWTIEIATKGYPELKQLYRLYDQEDFVFAKPLTHFKHNYNYVSRAVMYQWFNKHLKLGWKEPIVEEDFLPLSREEASVWNAEHPQPAADVAEEQRLVRWITEDQTKLFQQLVPNNAESLAEYYRIIGGAWKTLLGRGVPAEGAISGEKVAQMNRPWGRMYTYLVQHKSEQEELPTLFLLPDNWNQEVIIWVHEQGKAGLLTAEGTVKPNVEKLLKQGYAIACADLLYQGEFLTDGEPVTNTRLVENRWGYAGMTFGYNYSLFVRRVHDILSLISYAKYHESQPTAIHLVGFDSAGPLAAAAAATAKDDLAKIVIDTQGFRFANLTRIDDPHFLSGSVKYGDLPAVLSLIAPKQLLVLGESGKLPTLTQQLYQVTDSQHQLRSLDVSEEEEEAAVIRFLE